MKLFFLLFLIAACGKDSSSQLEYSTFLASFEVTGLSSALWQDGEFRELHATGVRKLGSKSPFSVDDTFHLGSCGKAMTATVVATFVEEERLEWSAKLSTLFPHLSVHSDYANVSLDMLLAHRGGLRRDPAVTPRNVSGERARSTIAQAILEAPSSVPPGTFQYSNASYMVIAHLLERLENKPWETIVQERLFDRLQMKSCGFGPTSNPLEAEVLSPWGHWFSKNGYIPTHDDVPAPWAPAGTIHCKYQDWVKFLQNHMDGFNGQNGIIKASTFAKLHALYPAEGSTYTYGGWGRVERSWARGAALTHDGTNGYNFSRVWIAPKINAAIMSVSNSGGDMANKAVNDAVSELVRRNF